jgi:hypothetical protein
LEVACTKVGRHIVQFNQKGKCQWALLVVKELKDDFLVGLSAWYNGVNMLILLVVISILLGIVVRKISSLVYLVPLNIFNSVIHTLSPRKIYMLGGMFTWTNNQQPPTRTVG